MKKFLLLIISLFVLLGCSDKPNQNNDNASLNDNQKAMQVLRVGLDANYPPFEFISDAEITGFDVDLVKELSTRIGFKYQIVNMGFDGLIPALKGGKIDAIASAMSSTEDRKKSIDFTNPYFSTKNLYMKKKENDEITSKDSLSGKRIGVQLGTIQEASARKINGGNVVPAEDIVSSVMALKVGKIDVVIVDSAIGQGYLNQNSDLMDFFLEDDGSEGFSIAFDKDKHKELIVKINEELSRIKSDGTYNKLLEKYDIK